MPLSLEGTTGLDAAMVKLNNIYNTIGYTVVDDQPVKQPSADEQKALEDAASEVVKAITAAKKSAED